jgi:uncharacterized protein (DUF2252 family)
MFDRWRYLALILLVFPVSCAPPADNERQAYVVNTLTKADEPLLRSRPKLMAGKYGRMARSLYDFYRGTYPLFVSDINHSFGTISTTRFNTQSSLPLCMGDAHPENFGTLRASDGSFAVEANDFDAVDRYPFWWGLRRLTVGMVLAARQAALQTPANQALWNAESEHEMVRQMAIAYTETIQAYAQGAARERMASDFGNPNLIDIFKRSLRDQANRAELSSLTTIDANNQRHLVRGQLDSEDPENVLIDLPTWAQQSLPTTLAHYQTTLLDPPPPDYFQLLDSVRVLGSGVASWPRIRMLILVQGPSADPSDDVILELKELTDSNAQGWYSPGRYASSVQDRVRSGSRLAWYSPNAEPLWGTSDFLGLPVQLKQETEAFKNVRISRMVDDRGTPKALTELGKVLARLLARIHSSQFPQQTPATPAISASIGNNAEGFAQELANASRNYADQVYQDWQLFRTSLRELGPTLGVGTATDEPTSISWQELLGTPPPVQPFE